MERQVEAMLRGGQFKQLLETYVKGLRETYDLKRMEIEVLYYLRHNPEQNTAKDITLFLHMNKGHISQTTEALCQKGYLSATKDGDDYRIVHYSITQNAVCVVEEIDAAIEKLYRALFAGVSDTELETLKRVAAQMANNISLLLPM